MIKRELQEKVWKYHSLTEKALQKVAEKKGLDSQQKKQAHNLREMAKNYFSDACHFEENKEQVLALAAFSYAHAWLDAGVKLGLLDGKEDDQLFTLP
jgi:uncharacterized protein